MKNIFRLEKVRQLIELIERSHPDTRNQVANLKNALLS